MGTALRAYSTQIHRKSRKMFWSWRVKCQWPCCASRNLQIYETSVYLLKWKCFSLFVSVLQWINDALVGKHFMISGTNCSWTADSALDCDIATAGLALREPSFNPDGRGLWINLHTQPIFFHPLLAHIYTNISLCILPMSTENALKSKSVGTVWSSLGQSHEAQLLVLLKWQTVGFW